MQQSLAAFSLADVVETLMTLMCVPLFAYMGTVCAAMYMQIICDCVFNVLMASAAHPPMAWTH